MSDTDHDETEACAVCTLKNLLIDIAMEHLDANDGSDNASLDAVSATAQAAGFMLGALFVGTPEQLEHNIEHLIGRYRDAVNRGLAWAKNADAEQAALPAGATTH